MEFEESFVIKRIDKMNISAAAERMQMMTVHCLQCNTVMADSLGVCGEVKCMDSLLCLKVTADVVIGAVDESGRGQEMANCIYSPLRCRCCHSAVGRVLHSTPSRWASVRSFFLLHKANISCYLLDSPSLVKASELSLDLKPLKLCINEATQQVEEKLQQMSLIQSRLADRTISSELHH
ncbi:protein Mis18-beta [Nematolebias whitei]|uniref:protein Mis18-beta n=1 Tax=Nematolebias whitei TaxID=451745 RepID=UPI0018990139|nr:protein Mis18-beta [Nematolebias whitei]